ASRWVERAEIESSQPVPITRYGQATDRAVDNVPLTRILHPIAVKVDNPTSRGGIVRTPNVPALSLPVGHYRPHPYARKPARNAPLPCPRLQVAVKTQSPCACDWIEYTDVITADAIPVAHHGQPVCATERYVGFT